MKVNEKGFTLIELLAVIVILAIIALIATPIVLNIINNARRSAAEDTVYGTMEAIKLAYTESMMNPTTYSLPLTVTFTNGVGKVSDANTATGSEKDLALSGSAPKSGTITLGNNSQFSATGLSVNGFTCNVTNSTVTCS